MKYIIRFDYGNTRGWWVRIRRKAHSCSKLFSDGVYGGTEAAKEAAIAWRDEMLRKHPPVRVQAAERRDKRVKTGVKGLYVLFPKRTRGSMPAICISILDKRGNHLTRSYSVRKWGLRKALWKACTAMAKNRFSDEQKILHQANTYFAKAYPNLTSALEDEYQETEENNP